MRSNVEPVELGLPVKRMPFLVSHCTCRSSATRTWALYLPTNIWAGDDFPAAKTICQSGTPAHTHLPRGQGWLTPALAYP